MNPDASPRELRGTKRDVPYQILARRLSGRTIVSPSLQPHAALNSGMFDNGPSTRHLPGECASVLIC